MPIIVVCPDCHMRLKAPDTAVGRTFLCPQCKAKIAVAIALPPPSPPAAPAAPPAKPSAPARPAAPSPLLSPKIKVIDKPLLNQPAPPTRLTVVGEAEPTNLAPSPMPTRPTPMPAKPRTAVPPPPPAEEIFSDFDVVDEDEKPTQLAADDGALDELEEVPEELDELEEIEPASPLDVSRLLAHAIIRLTKKPPPGIAYRLTSQNNDLLAMAIAMPIPGSNSKIGGPPPIRFEVREGDDEVLRATVGPVRSAPGTIEVLGPGDERLGTFTFEGWSGLLRGLMRIERPNDPPLQLIPQPSRRRAVLAGPDGREMGELVPGNGAWFVTGGIWEARFGPGLTGRNQERLLLLCAGLGLELLERQRGG